MVLTKSLRLYTFGFALFALLFATGVVVCDLSSKLETKPPPSWVHTEPLRVPSKTLMGPGPSTAHPRVLEAAQLPLLGHLHPEFVKIMDEVSSNANSLRSENSRVSPYLKLPSLERRTARERERERERERGK